MKISTHVPTSAGIALVLALSAFGPAVGQPSLAPPPPAAEGPVAPIFTGPPPPTPPPPVALPRRPATLHAREDRLDALLDDAISHGAIDPIIGAKARFELDSIRYTEDRMRRRNNGKLTDAEAFALDARLKKVSQIIRGRTGDEP